MRTALALVLALGIFGSPAPLRADDAGTMSIVPIRLDLHDAGHAQNLLVINGADTPMTVAVAAYGWTQSAGIPLGLSESKNLVVYPRLLDIAAHGERTVRVGIVDAPGAVESAYRLTFTQVAADAASFGPKAPGAISFLLRITMPVFVAANVKAAPGSNVVIEGATVGAHTLGVKVRNTGSIHEMVSYVTADLFDARGAHLGSRTATGWYLLAGSEQSYSAKLGALRCGTVAHVELHVRTGTGDTIVKNVVPDSDCAH